MLEIDDSQPGGAAGSAPAIDADGDPHPLVVLAMAEPDVGDGAMPHPIAPTDEVGVAPEPHAEPVALGAALVEPAPAEPAALGAAPVEPAPLAPEAAAEASVRSAGGHSPLTTARDNHLASGIAARFSQTFIMKAALPPDARP